MLVHISMVVSCSCNGTGQMDKAIMIHNGISVPCIHRSREGKLQQVLSDLCDVRLGQESKPVRNVRLQESSHRVETLVWKCKVRLRGLTATLS